MFKESSSEQASNMNALAKLRNIGESKPYQGFAKLNIGYHKIVCFRLVPNKFAKENNRDEKSILVELEEEVLFLPQYFMNVLNKDDINELNSVDEIHYLYFGGKREANK